MCFSLVLECFLCILGVSYYEIASFYIAIRHTKMEKEGTEKKSFYITTTLPYVNAKPHIGHALEFIQADVIARWHSILGDDVVFNVWTDEHGLKMLQKAQEADMKVEDFIAMNVKTFEAFFEQFNIVYTNFYRTSLPYHDTVAQGMRERCVNNGDIYKKQYSGLYCVWCELFKTAKDLVDGKCPDHGTVPILLEQENYFFKLSKYRDQLANYYKGNAVLIPENKLAELLNFVENMEDISVSRTRESLSRWVSVPGDDSQVMYVRFDALSNYIGAVWFPHDMEKVEQFWPGVQIFGPDNLRFQGGIWQGMLASAGFPFTKKLLMHGMIFGSDGNKMSKSLWNVVDPMEQREKYGVDAMRYYLIAGIPTFGDGSYKEEDLINIANSHLADSFGNLLSRVITLANKKEVALVADRSICSPEVQEMLIDLWSKVEAYFNSYDLYNAAGAIHEIAMYANKYMNDIKPWDKETDSDLAKQCLQDLGVILYVLIPYYSAIVPDLAARAKELLEKMEKGVLFQKVGV